MTDFTGLVSLPCIAWGISVPEKLSAEGDRQSWYGDCLGAATGNGVTLAMVLCIEQSKSATAARDYFTKHLAPGDYYLRGTTTSLSQWLGKELGRLGLAEGQEVT